MFRKNIANQTTFNNLLVNHLEIQSKGEGLIIYDTDPLNPVFSVNPTSSVINMSGTLTVTGSASFETINISEYSAGMLALGANNPADIMDLGLNMNYNDGTSKYTGIVRDASDSLKRWTFFKEITTTPTTTISDIDSTKLDSVRMNALYVNDGSELAPSITFHNDVGVDTGLYLIAENNMGVTAGGKKIVDIKYTSGTDTTFQLDSSTSFNLKKINTIDDAASITLPSVSTGHLYLKSESAADKWMKFYSFTNAGVPSYSGAVFTSPSVNYFMLNTGTNFEIVRNSTVTSDTSAPDYRDGTTAQLLVVGASSLESKNKILIPSGSVSAPSMTFSSETTTGLFLPASGSIAAAIGGANVLNISSTAITTTQIIRNVNGTIALPAYSFTSNTGTGMLRDSTALYENITFSAGGTSLGYMWLQTTPQWVMGSVGSAAIPSITWTTDISTGLYVPTTEAATGQMSVSLSSMEIARFRRRAGTGIGSIEFYNSFAVTPDGSIKKAVIASTDTRFSNIVKTGEAWFQAYNLIDSTPVFLFTFRSAGAVGKDYSNNGYDAVLVNSPGIAVLSRDSNSVVKRDVLDLTGNTNKYLNLTSRISALTGLDNVSISFWFRISGALSEDNTIFSCYKTAGAKEISIKILSDGNAYPNALQVTVMSDSLTTLQYHTATSADLGTPSPVSVKDGLWHNVVLHLGSGTGSPNAKHIMFFDCVELNVASNNVYFTSPGSNVGNPEASVNSFDDLTFGFCSIGALYDGGIASQYYTGQLKDFYLTGRLVSEGEIDHLCQEPYVYTYGLDAAVVNVSQLNALSGVNFSDGTAANPSVTFTSDSSLGMYKPATNTLGFATSGSERLTLTSTLLSYNTGINAPAFEIDGTTTNSWLKLIMNPTGNFGPRVVFQYSTGTPARHSIRSSHHASTITSNFLDFYLFDTSGTDAAGLGTNQIMRIGQTASGTNTGLLTIYGAVRAHDGTVSVPAYSFTNSTGLGLYRIGADVLGISATGTLRMRIDSVVTVGNASSDTTTRLYVPSGTQALPSYSFIDDTNTGIFSSAADNVDITCGGTLITNFNSAGLLNQMPIIVDVGSTAAFVVRQNGGPLGGDIFTVDTTNSRIGLGYTNLFMSRQDTYNDSTNQRLLLDSTTSNTQINGLSIYNTLYSNTGAVTSQILIGRDTASSNSGNILFFYAGNGSTSNRLSLGIQGVNTNLLQVDGTNRVRSNATTFEVSGAAKFESQINALVGSAAAPSYSFTGDLTTGIYRPSAGQVGTATNGVLRQLVADTYIEFSQPIRLAAGTNSLPSLSFSSDGANNTGLYWMVENRFAAVCGTNRVMVFNNSSSGESIECLNALEIKPDSTNLRVFATNKKFRLTSNQTIIPQASAVHLKFLSDPNLNTSTQDKSIFGTTVTINGTIAYTTNTIALTDTNGTGLLNMSAITLPDDSSSYVQTSSDTDLLKISEFNLIIKVKIIAFPSSGNGTLISLLGNSSNVNNYFNFGVTSTAKWFLNIRALSVLQVSIVGNITLTTNTWYTLIVTCTGSGISVSVNGTTDSTTSTYAFTFNSFSDVTNPIVRIGSQNSDPQNANSYIHEVLLQPTSVADTSTATYRTQAHEIYTNKLQLTNGSGSLVEEGYILISDKGNNVNWDNSIQIYPGYVQFNSSKVLRAPNGTASLPSYAFSSANDGMYLSGTNTVAITTNGIQRASISTSQFSVASSVDMLINSATASTSSSTGALVIAGGIGLGNGSATPSRINFGSSYTVADPGSNKLISLLDTANNNYQFVGFGINSNILRYHVSSTSADHVFYAATSSSAANELFRIKGSGVVQVQNGAVGAPAYSFINDTTTGFYRIGSNNIGAATNGVKRLDISDSVTGITNSLELSAGFKRSVSTISVVSATLTSAQNIVLCSYETDSSNVTITLPAASTNIGAEYTIIKTGNGGGSVIINTASGSDFIDNASRTSVTIFSLYEKITLICAQSNRWYTV